MISMILFDKQMETFRKSLLAYLFQTGSFFDFVCSNHIDLKELEKRGSILLQDKSALLRG